MSVDPQNLPKWEQVIQLQQELTYHWAVVNQLWKYLETNVQNVQSAIAQGFERPQRFRRLRFEKYALVVGPKSTTAGVHHL